MRVAFVVPGFGDVPAVFSHDMMRAAAITASRPNIEMRIMAVTEEANTETRQAAVDAAVEWGADLVIFPPPLERIAMDAFEAILDKAEAELPEAKPVPKIEIASHLGGRNT